MTRTVHIADDVAAALGPEQVARLTGPEWIDQRVQCWECDGWMETGEDVAVLLVRVTDLVDPDTGASTSFALHSHPACSPSKILVTTEAEIRARRGALATQRDEGDDVDAVATVFDTGRGSAYPVVMFSYRTELIADSPGPERVDLVVSGLMSFGWHLVSNLADPPGPGPAGFRLRFTHERPAPASPGVLELLDPAGQVETAVEVTPGRYWRPGVAISGQTVLLQGSRYLTDWERRGRAGVKAAVRAGSIVGGIVPVELRGPGNDVPLARRR